MSKHKVIYLKDYSVTSFSILTCKLEFDIYEEYVTVVNTMQIQRTIEGSNELVLNGVDLELVTFKVDSKISTNYKINDEALSLKIEKEKFELEIITKIYPQNNTELEGLYKSDGIFCTQNEPQGFRKITYFLDRPDALCLFETKVIADKKAYPIILSNGNLKESGALANGRHYAIWDDPFYKPTYLFALVAGDLGCVNDSFTTCSGREIELNIYVDKGNESKCTHAMTSLKKSMTWDEEVYGREYDLDIYNIVAVDSFNMGAMENKGLNIFNSHYVLADTDTASDVNFLGIESVIAHEYFHNYSGNRVTCRDWFQLTLKEGFTVFRDQSFSADMNSEVIQRIEDVSALRERQFVEDASATSHPIRPESYMQINNFYTSTVYEKGAEIIRMMYTLVGKENFRKATDLYFETFDAKAVTCEDFLWSVESSSDVDLTQFKRWYHQERTPLLHVESSYDENSKTFSFTCKQEVPLSVKGLEQEAYFYPLNIALFSDDGALLIEKTVIISQMSEVFSFENIEAKPLLSLNRNFSAPIIVKYDEADYSFLMQYEKDGFSQFEAMQSYAKDVIMQMSVGNEVNQSFIEAYGNIIHNDTLDVMFKAKLLDLPSISVLMQLQEKIDVAPLYEARDTLQALLAANYKAKFLEIYTHHHDANNENIESSSMASRALKNRALSFLMSAKDEQIEELCLKQYSESKTMTDRIVALDLIENHLVEHSDKAFSDFYARYKEDSLVMNKYFSILSASEREGTLDRVLALQHDEAFDIKVPNLVRALYGVFARNYKHFHSKDGYGYNLIATIIIDLDGINPQIASGLAGAFKSFDKLNDTNKALMRKELKRILEVENLSDNVYEIIDKIVNNK